MSCRVLGRNIEDAVLSAVVAKARRAKVNRVSIDYKKTEKNEPVIKFLRRYGISCAESGRAPVVYKKGAKPKFDSRSRHVKVISK